MNTVIEMDVLESSADKTMVDQGTDDFYFEDFFSDDKCLHEELEPYEFTTSSEAANEDVWDLLDIDDSDWDDGFLIF